MTSKCVSILQGVANAYAMANVQLHAWLYVIYYMLLCLLQVSKPCMPIRELCTVGNLVKLTLCTWDVVEGSRGGTRLSYSLHESHLFLGDLVLAHALRHLSSSR